MENEISELSVFEKIKKINQYGQEYWSARELSDLLEYSEFTKFKKVLEKAIESCKNSNQSIENHYLQTGKMVMIGSNSEREREVIDYQLSR